MGNLSHKIESKSRVGSSEEDDNIAVELSRIESTGSVNEAISRKQGSKLIHARFKSHSVEEWGLSINFSAPWNEWELTSVDSGKQAGKLGLRVQDKLIAIDDVDIAENTLNDVKQKLTQGVACRITISRLLDEKSNLLPVPSRH